MTTSNKSYLPAEWDRRVSRVLLAFPDAHTDWNYMLPEVRACYAEIIRGIINDARLEVVIIGEGATVSQFLQVNKLPTESITIAEIPYNDTWARDFGVISTINSAGETEYVDFRFNGWGLKYPANKDNMICGRLAVMDFLPHPLISRQGFILEGGAIDTDGQGTLLTTSICQLSKNRNAEFSKLQIDNRLKKYLGVERVLWLNHGYLEGDDTDSHVDTLARFINPETIAYVKCYRDSDEHSSELNLMEEELKKFVTADGKPYKLVPLPLPDPIFDEEGHRLPATYANFLITHRAILVPTYGQSVNDRQAIETLEAHANGRRVVGIDCRALIRQHGSLHCVTMQML